MMELLNLLADQLRNAEYAIDISENQIHLLDDDNEIAGVIELVGGWCHIRLFLGGDFGSPELLSSLLRANDRVLGFRFSVDEVGEASARAEVLIDFEPLKAIHRTLDNMTEVVPHYWDAFDACRKREGEITEAELDGVADKVEETLH